MLLVTSAVKTVLSISQNGINQITLNKQFVEKILFTVNMLYFRY
jgi:hypothetical protein